MIETYMVCGELDLARDAVCCLFLSFFFLWQVMMSAGCPTVSCVEE